MMNTIVKEIENILGQDYEVNATKADKGNGVVLNGICIGTREDNVRPTIYVDKYLETLSAREIAAIVVDQYNNTPSIDVSDFTSNFLNFDIIKDSLTLRLVNTERNKEMLADLVSEDICDLSAYVIAIVGEDENGLQTVKIHKDHVTHWNVSESEILEAAKVGLVREGAKLASMMSIMMGLVLDDEKEMLEELGDAPMLVLSNKSGVGGASQLLRTEMLDDACGRLEVEKLMIIPSSIHEVIIIPDNGNVSYEEVKAMIGDVNDACVSDMEVLGTHPYLYEKGTGLTM